MKITRIEPHTKNRYNIYIDYKFAFRAYGSDLKALQVEEGEDVDETSLYAFFDEVLKKRAKKRAMDLLVKQGRCREELKRKLRDSGYPDEVVEAAISYVSSFGYLDDQNYAIQYLRSNKKKSRKQIEYELTQKGVSSDFITNAFYEFQQEISEFHDTNEDFEMISIKELIMKKITIKQIVKDEMEPAMYYKELDKIKMFLYRKGYPIEKIKKAMSECTSFHDSIYD